MPLRSTQGNVSQITTVGASGSAYQIPPPAHDSIFDVTLTANCILSMPATPPTPGTSFTLLLRQDATGARVITWPTLKWPNGYAPLLTPTPSTSDIFAFTYVAGGWIAFPAGYDVR